MTGDFSRDRRLNALARGYSAVMAQQGRLSTDSDWNEAFAILTDRTESATSATLGASGTLKRAPGFGVTATPTGFAVGAGRYWVDGLRIENAATLAFNDQPGQAAFPAGASGDVLIWLEVWQDVVTATDDRRLADPALGGVDTTVRLLPRWRVRMGPAPADVQGLTERSRCGALLPQTGTAGRLSVSVLPAGSVSTDDCMIPPEAGYVSQENQLYRVQVIQGGPRASARFVFSRENGAVTASLRQEAGQFVLGDTRPDEGLGFRTGDIVEIYDDRLRAQGLPGSLHRLTLTGGVASFDPAPPAFGPLVNPGLRRWDQRPAAPETSLAMADAVPLERGLQVGFSVGDYLAGQYWVFEARAATGQPVWPPVAGGPAAVPAMGGNRTSVALALGRVSGTTLTNLTDLRAVVPSLACLSAEDIRFDDSACAFEAGTVQEAIEALCRRGSGLCSVVVRTEAEFRAAIAAVPAGGALHLCLAGGRIDLAAGLRLSGLGHVTIQGAGPQSVLALAQGEVVLDLADCASLRVVDLTLRAGGHGRSGRFSGREGAVTLRNTPEVSIERVRASIGHGSDRNACALATFDCADVTIRDCHLTVGQLQTGIQVINSVRAVIETNVLTALTDPAPALTDDTVVMGRLSRGLMWFHNRRYGQVTDRDEIIDLSDMRGQVNSAEASTQMAQVPVFARWGIAGNLVKAFDAHDGGRSIGATTIRKVLRGYMARAIRNGGRLDLARGSFPLFRDIDLDLASRPMMAQGIVVAGASVTETVIRANRIEGANEGIRVAASSTGEGDAWTGARPVNRIRRAVICDNRIELRPLSAVTAAYGIALGHVERLTCTANELSFPRPKSRRVEGKPHLGLYQYGWRGPLFLGHGNVVEHAGIGYVAGPEQDDGTRGVLRDNSAEACGRDHALASSITWVWG